MTVLVSSGGELVTAGGHNTGLARPSVPLSMYGSGVPLIGDRVVSFAELYYTQWAVATAVNKLVRQISRLPLKVYRRTAAGERERMSSGLLAGLFGTPWAGGAPTHLKQAATLPLFVHGNGLLRKVRDERNGPVDRFQPIPWWRIVAAHGADSGQVEVWETTQPGAPRYLDPEDVVHFAFRGLDSQIGVSPLRQLGVTLSIEDAAQRYQQGLMRNSARPPSAMTASAEFFQTFDKDERQQMWAQARADVREIYSGPEKAGTPAMLPPGMDWKQVGHTAVEAALIDQRKIAREEVFACYDVSPPLVGLLERSTFNNISELHRMLYVTVLGPPLTLVEETFEAQLIAPEPSLRGGLFVEFDLSEVLKGDLLQRSQALALQIGYGVLTIDEARQIENRPTFGLPETQLPLYPSNNLTPVGMTPDPNKPIGAAPSESAVQDAAKIAASMQEGDLQALLGRTGGSVIDAIFAIAAGTGVAQRYVPALT